MRTHLRTLMNEPSLRRSLAEHGLATIQRRHTCAHRVDELMAIVQELRRGTHEETLML
jgi:spore maturation protein CgeB